MSRPPLEVADVIRRHGQEFMDVRGSSLTSVHRYVLTSLAACRTAALGGHVDKCNQCGHERPAYNSCRNRHCPKCQGSARAEWLEARRSELLPVPYFHVVFTLPEPVARIALQNKKVMYNILFSASAETLQEVAANPKHLGASIGILSVLHTWGQNLEHHPHVHCVVPGGGLTSDGSQWKTCREDFFLPVRVLSRVFRGKFLAKLHQAYQRGELGFHGSLSGLCSPAAFQQYLKPCLSKEWVVYCKRPFGGPDQVLKYLARYTHRVAISNGRLLSLDGGKVTFRWKNYANGNDWQTMTLRAVEFIRRFLLHVLPKGFVRIRHYGLLANRHRKKKLDRCRELIIGQGVAEKQAESIAAEMPDVSDTGDAPEASSARCPSCKDGSMVCIWTQPRRSVVEIIEFTPFFDTS